MTYTASATGLETFPHSALDPATPLLMLALAWIRGVHADLPAEMSTTSSASSRSGNVADSLCTWLHSLCNIRRYIIAGTRGLRQFIPGHSLCLLQHVQLEGQSPGFPSWLTGTSQQHSKPQLLLRLLQCVLT